MFMGSQLPEVNGPTEVDKPPDKMTKKEKKQALVRQARRTVGLLLEAIEKERVTSPNHDSALTVSKNALKAFSSSEAVSVEKLRNSDGLKSVVVAIKKYPTSSAVVASGCDTIAALTILDNTVVNEIIKFGAIDVIIGAVSAQAKKGSDDARVSAIKILRNLTQTEENRAQIFKAKGLEGVIETMKSSSQSPRTLSHAALVLSNLAFGNAEIKGAVGALGGIAAICRGMHEHKDFQAMQARGSLALRNLCFSSEDNQRIAGESGAAEALLWAIEAYKDDREVVHQSCVAIANLSNTSEENRTEIVQAGGAGTIVKLMEMYQESLTVHADAISIIRNISVANSDAQLEIGASGGVGFICRALEKFGKDENLVDKACTAIRYLCFLSENRDKVREARGMERLVLVLKQFVGDAKITENALLAIGNATFENAENKAIIGRVGGIVAIVKSIEQHRLNAGIQEHGCRVLRNLADGYELNRRIEAENGGINTGVFAMMGYPEVASVQEQACAMLLNIALCDGMAERLEQADVRRLAEKAISMHGKHRGVLLQAGTLVDRLNGHDVLNGEEEDVNSVGSRRGGLIKILTRKMSSRT